MTCKQRSLKELNTALLRNSLDKEQLLTIIPKLSEYRKRRVSEPVVKTRTRTKQIIKKTPTIKGGKY